MGQQSRTLLFPIRVKQGEYDPRACLAVVLALLMESPPRHLRLRPVRPHDLRHHAITRMLENGVDGDLVNAISGHVSKRMREFYSHQRVRVRYEAAQAIEPDYDVRKLVADGRRRSKQERLKVKLKPQQKEPSAPPVETDKDLEELKRLKIRVDQRSPWQGQREIDGLIDFRLRRPKTLPLSQNQCGQCPTAYAQGGVRVLRPELAQSVIWSEVVSPLLNDQIT